MRQEKLEQIKELIPLMASMVDEDLAIGIWDREGTVLYFQKPKSFGLNLEIGHTIEDKNDKLFKAMETGKVIHNTVPKEVYGVAIEGNIVPIFDNREVVGCITCVYSIEKYTELQYKTEKMKDVMEEYKDCIHEILESTANSKNHFEEINKSAQKLEESVKGVYTVVDSIKSNTSRTKMLALNASIEAARAGESGKGFAIVANEMSKLSQMSTEAVADINYTLEDMNKAIGQVISAIKNINECHIKDSGDAEKILSDLNKINR
ncbi:MAG: histidine kinase N-terminal domain-containing protein [Clostridium sp.]